MATIPEQGILAILALDPFLVKFEVDVRWASVIGY
jgi:hypothetical protein